MIDDDVAKTYKNYRKKKYRTECNRILIPTSSDFPY